MSAICPALYCRFLGIPHSLCAGAGGLSRALVLRAAARAPAAWLPVCPIAPRAGTMRPTMASHIDSTTPDVTRRSFLKTAVAAAATAPLAGVLDAQQGAARAQPAGAGAPLIAYVGTFSSPLHDVLPTQVDLPPGNGRGIHIFQVDRATGALTPRGRPRNGHEPELPRAERRRHAALLGQRDRPRRRREEGTVSAFAIDRADGRLEPAQHGAVRRGRADVRQRAPVREVPARRQLLRRLRRGAADPRRRPPRARDRREGRCRHDRAAQGHERAARQLRVQRPRPDARAHDPGRPLGPLRAARRSGARPDLRVEVRRPARHAHARRPARGLAAARRRPAALPVPSRTAAGSTRSRKKARRSCCSTTTPRPGDSPRGRRSRRCRPGMPAATSARRSSFRPTAGSSTPATACTTASASSRSGRTGELTYVGDEWTRGNYPRSFAFDPTGRFLYCCNQRADNVTVFRVDRKTGGLALHRPVRAGRQPVAHRLRRSRDGGVALQSGL